MLCFNYKPTLFSLPCKTFRTLLEEYVFGLAQLPNKGDILFITGGEKDVLSLSAHHFNAICFNSETAQIPRGIIESLSLRFLQYILNS